MSTTLETQFLGVESRHEPLLGVVRDELPVSDHEFATITFAYPDDVPSQIAVISRVFEPYFWKEGREAGAELFNHIVGTIGQNQDPRFLAFYFRYALSEGRRDKSQYSGILGSMKEEEARVKALMEQPAQPPADYRAQEVLDRAKLDDAIPTEMTRVRYRSGEPFSEQLTGEILVAQASTRSPAEAVATTVGVYAGPVDAVEGLSQIAEYLKKQREYIELRLYSPNDQIPRNVIIPRRDRHIAKEVQRCTREQCLRIYYPEMYDDEFIPDRVEPKVSPVSDVPTTDSGNKEAGAAEEATSSQDTEEKGEKLTLRTASDRRQTSIKVYAPAGKVKRNNNNVRITWKAIE